MFQAGITLRPEPIYDDPPLAHDRGNVKTALHGAYCPIPDPRLLERWLKKGAYRLGDIGLEKRCTICCEYWPADTEFFFTAPGTPGGLLSSCKDCYCISTGRSAGARVKKRLPSPHAALLRWAVGG